MNLEKLLQTSFGDCAPHIGQALQQDLPKLLACARGLQSKFGIKFVFSTAVFEPLEPGYLEKCGMNLKASLAGSDCPTQVRLSFVNIYILNFRFMLSICLGCR